MVDKMVSLVGNERGYPNGISDRIENVKLSISIIG